MVLHEATRTGAPKIGGLIAAALKPSFDVEVVVLRAGPLQTWLEEKIGLRHVKVLERGWYHSRSFESRVETAIEYLRKSDCDLVYVNSLASSEFLVAASVTGKKSILHLHEKSGEMYSLLRQGVTKYNILAYTKAMILAGSGLVEDFTEVFGGLPERVLDWGIAIDVGEMFQLCFREPGPLKNFAERPWKKGERLAIGMVGHASHRKGADIFFQLAQIIPKKDFIWIGNWARSESPDNPIADKMIAKARLANFYTSGGVANPYSYMKDFDLFLLSSREDPNPIVVAEAMLLNIPVMAFSRSTAVPDFLGRYAILCYGIANVDNAYRILKRINRHQLQTYSLSPSIEELRPMFDIEMKIAAIVDMLLDL